MKLFADAQRAFQAADVAGVVVDNRQNGGGLDDMAAAMLGSFTARRRFYEYASFRVPGTNRFEVWKYNDATGTYPWPGLGTSVLPTLPRYRGPVVALIDNGCISSCEGLAMGIHRLPEGRTVGVIGTNGSFGMAGGEAAMPGGYSIHWPYGRSLDHRHRVQIDSRKGVGGIRPDVGIPLTARRAIRMRQGHDVGLSAALRALRPSHR